MKAMAAPDRREPRNMHLHIDARNAGTALEVAGEAQCSPPVGYRWERITLKRAREKGSRMRVSIVWRHMRKDAPILDAQQIIAHPITARLIELGERAPSLEASGA